MPRPDADAIRRERAQRRARVVERALRRLILAVVLVLAAYGAWELGNRFLEVDPPALPDGPRREPPLPVESRSPEIAPLQPAAIEELPRMPMADSLSTPSPAEDEAGSQVPADGGGIAEANAVPTLEPGALLMPVMGAAPPELRDDFHDARGETRRHDAIDIPAPRNTPVVAVDDGTIAKLFVSERGGLTIYLFDRTESYCYYYAHLEGYAPDLREGERVARGQVIGYVGTSGNAPKDTPHLHFSVNRLGAEKRWWEGTPINPFPLLRAGGSTPGADGIP